MIYNPLLRRAQFYWAMSLLVMGLGMIAGTHTARAELDKLVVTKQYGVGYLPMIIMEDQKLIEKYAKAEGLNVQVDWPIVTAGNLNDALISGSAHIVTGGLTSFLTAWTKTKGSLNIKGISSICNMPLYLNSRNPKVKTIKDFTAADRIGMPAVKVSIQAQLLQMAAEKEFGPGQQFKLDDLTTSMTHPDSMAALMSGKGEVNAHFASPPFQYSELVDPNIRTVLNSYDLLGGPSTFLTVFATSKFRDENPKLYKAFLNALDESIRMINNDKKWAAERYVALSTEKLPADFVLTMLKNPEIQFTTTPAKVMVFVDFLARIGNMKVKPESWKDLYFDNMHAKAGS